jgi:hypothetical protein
VLFLVQKKRFEFELLEKFAKFDPNYDEIAAFGLANITNSISYKTLFSKALNGSNLLA